MELFEGFHIFILCLHGISAILVAWRTQIAGHDWKAPAKISYIEWHRVDGRTGQCTRNTPCNVVIRELNVGHISVGLEISGFFFLSFFFLLMLVLPLRAEYAMWIQEKKNPLRWMEYSLSSPLMIVIMCQLNGMFSVWTWVFAAGLTFALIGYGWTHEELLLLRRTANEVATTTSMHYFDVKFWSRKKHFRVEGTRVKLAKDDDALYLTYAWFSFAFLWLPIIGAFVYTIHRAYIEGTKLGGDGEKGTPPPQETYVLVFGLFILFGLFGAVHTTRVFRKMSGDQIESWYITLSFVSKFFLAATLYAILEWRYAGKLRDESVAGC